MSLLDNYEKFIMCTININKINIKNIETEKIASLNKKATKRNKNT